MKVKGKGKSENIRAFTLLEALLYSVILSIIVAALTSAVLMIYRNKTVIEDRINVNEDLRILIKSIRDDMYLANDFEINPDGSLTILSPLNGGTEVTYYESGSQVFRQENALAAVELTAETTDIREFTITDISSPNAAGTIRIELELANYPRGTLKPEIMEEVTSTISLNFL